VAVVVVGVVVLEPLSRGHALAATAVPAAAADAELEDTCGEGVGVNEKQVAHTRYTTRTTSPTTTRRTTPSLNNDRRWRGDGAYHLPYLGGWPRGWVVMVVAGVGA